MKKTLILIALMTGVALAWAAPPDRLPNLLAPPAEARTVVVVGGGVPAAGCNPTTNEVGDRTQESTSETFNSGYQWAFRVQADCSGTLQNAYIYHNNTTQAEAKLLFYAASSTTPQSGDALVVASSEINGGTTTGLKTASIGSGSVVLDNYYWVVLAVSPTNDWSSVRTDTQSLYYKACDATCYGTPPSTMGTGWSEAASSAPFTAYGTIQ